jgi:hypothetical protein
MVFIDFFEMIRQVDLLDGFFIGLVLALNVYLKRFGMWPYSLLTFPATVFHELSHWLIALIFLASPALPRLWPTRLGKTWVMGSVMFVPTILNRIPVALAPFLLLPIGLFLMGRFVHPLIGWQYFLGVWLIGNMISGFIPSRQDFKITLPVFLFCVLIYCGYLYLIDHQILVFRR